MPLALPRPLEAAIQEMERRGAEATRKIEEATKVVDESEDCELDFDDPSVVKHVNDLKRVTTRAKAVTAAPSAIGTPPSGSAPPVPSGTRIARLVRPPRKPPRDD